jgi:hypothetical protein
MRFYQIRVKARVSLILFVNFVDALLLGEGDIDKAKNLAIINISSMNLQSYTFAPLRLYA